GRVAAGVVGSGPLADFTSGGISVSPFPGSATTDYYAFSQDDTGNQSTCVGPFTFVDDQSEAQPTITSSTPTTPSNTNPSTITLSGSGASNGPSATTVYLYRNDDTCGGGGFPSGALASTDGDTFN